MNMNNLKIFLRKKTNRICLPFWLLFSISFALINIGNLFQNANELSLNDYSSEIIKLVYDIGSSFTYPLVFFEALVFFVLVFFLYYVYSNWKDDLLRLRSRGLSCKSTQLQVVICMGRNFMIVLFSSIMISLIFGLIFAGIKGFAFVPYLAPKFAYYFFIFVIIFLFFLFSYFFFFFQFRKKKLLKMIKDLS